MVERTREEDAPRNRYGRTSRLSWLAFDDLTGFSGPGFFCLLLLVRKGKMCFPFSRTQTVHVVGTKIEQSSCRSVPARLWRLRDPAVGLSARFESERICRFAEPRENRVFILVFISHCLNRERIESRFRSFSELRQKQIRIGEKIPLKEVCRGNQSKGTRENRVPS